MTVPTTTPSHAAPSQRPSRVEITPRRLRGARRSRLDMKVSPYLYIAPFFVIFSIFGAYPLLYTAWVALHNWEVGRFFSFKNSPGISSGLPIAFGNVRSVVHQTAGLSEGALLVDHGA